MKPYQERLVTITADTILTKLFPHAVIPHYVWIENGHLIAMAGTEFFSAGIIEACVERRIHLNHIITNRKPKRKLVWKTTTDEGTIVQNQQAATDKYNTYPMGILSFKTAGKHTITVSLVEGDPVSSSLESAVIKPVL